MSSEFHVSVSARTLTKLRTIAAARGISMAAVVGLVADSLDAPFVWRGVERPPRPLSTAEVSYRRRGPAPHRPGKRYTVAVLPSTHARLAAISRGHELTMPGALELACADGLACPQRAPNAQGQP